MWIFNKWLKLHENVRQSELLTLPLSPQSLPLLRERQSHSCRCPGQKWRSYADSAFSLIWHISSVRSSFRLHLQNTPTTQFTSPITTRIQATHIFRLDYRDSPLTCALASDLPSSSVVRRIARVNLLKPKADALISLLSSPVVAHSHWE